METEKSIYKKQINKIKSKTETKKEKKITSEKSRPCP